jgi:iron complex outermembrane receptor protein
LKNKIYHGVKQGFKVNNFVSTGIVILLSQAPLAYAKEAKIDQINQFDISPQSADESLIQFAQQANLTIIFPFSKVRNNTANALIGQFTVRQGIEALLKDTNLTAMFDDNGALTISLSDENEKLVEDSNIFTQILDFFTKEKVEIFTYPTPIEVEFELVIVKGLRASMQRSMDVKRSAYGVVDAIQAEDMGKFPDQNLAESLQRITGVSIDRSEGEGQFVTVRGFGPQFNTVLINGRRLATDNQGREFSFDTLASELVSGVQVHKTNPGSQQSGGIGSTIDIHTARPMDTAGFKVAGSVKAAYDSNSNNTSPQGSVLMSHSSDDDKFAWLVSVSHQKRQARLNEVQIDGWLLNTNIPNEQLSTTADNIFVPRNYDQRVRFDERTRTGGTLVLQYRPTNDLQLSMDYLASTFDVKTDSTSMGHWFTSSNLENVLTDINGTAIQFEQKIGHATDFHARTFDRPSKLKAVGLNIDWQASDSLEMNFDVSLSDASIKDTQGAANALSLIGYLSRSRFDHSSNNILPSISGFQTADASIIDAQGNTSGVSDYLDPANGRAHVMLRRGWNIRDDLDQYRIDANWDGDLEHISDILFGVLYTSQTKQNQRWDNEANGLHCTFCGYFDSPDIPDSFQTIFDAGDDFLSGISGSENIPSQWLQHDGELLFDFLEQSSKISLAALPGNNSFTINEQYIASYIQVDFSVELGDMLLTAQSSLRYEDTKITASGMEANLLELTILDQTELGQVTGTAHPEEIESNYSNWLPSLSLKLELNEDLVARLATSRSLTRPTMSQMSPSLALNTTRQGGDLRASSGNPGLQPYESSNLDLALEWYYAQSSHLSASYFRKKVDNFIVSTISNLTFNEVTDPSTGDDPNAPDENDQIAKFDLTEPINGETATVDGWEFSIQHDFPQSGFGILANMTMVNSNAELDRMNITQKFALTGLSDSQNLIVYYEKEPIQIRLAWNNRDGFLQSLVQIQGGEPTFVERYHQLDISASYAFNDHVSIFMEGINITGETLIKHGRYANQLLLAQDTGARYAFGVRGSF